jgi:DNA-directed RNA polymerase alpha subunit
MACTKDGSSDHPRTQVPVEVLGLSVRPMNCLKPGVIETVE